MILSYIIYWYFVPKMVQAYCEKEIVLVTVKKLFEITTTIYSNSKRSEQCFLKLVSGGYCSSNTLEQLNAYWN